jgi:hypothetical protein
VRLIELLQSHLGSFGDAEHNLVELSDAVEPPASSVAADIYRIHVALTRLRQVSLALATGDEVERSFATTGKFFTVWPDTSEAVLQLVHLSGERRAAIRKGMHARAVERFRQLRLSDFAAPDQELEELRAYTTATSVQVKLDAEAAVVHRGSLDALLSDNWPLLDGVTNAATHASISAPEGIYSTETTTPFRVTSSRDERRVVCVWVVQQPAFRVDKAAPGQASADVADDEEVEQHGSFVEGGT